MFDVCDMMAYENVDCGKGVFLQIVVYVRHLTCPRANALCMILMNLVLM